MLLTRIIGDCPNCKGKDNFGNCDVFGHELLRGCEDCDYRERFTLPELKKDVLYLDQFFFSHAYRGKESQFIEAEAKLKQAAHEQLLSIPFSSLHEEEAAMFSEREELREFIRSTSRGHKFEAQYGVERTQVLRAFDAWLQQRPSAYAFEPRDALDRDINSWDGYLSIEVRGFKPDPGVIRDAKLRSIAELVSIFDGWRMSTRTFDEDVEAETLGAADSYCRSYLRMSAEQAAGNLDAVAFPTKDAHVMASLLGMLGSKEPVEERWNVVLQFLKSDHFKNVPYHRLESTMFAALKAQVKDGAYMKIEEAKNKKLKGFFYDVKHIATYAPYCDAILIDKPMHALVTHPKVALEKNYGVKVFSRTNWDAFLAWIDGLQAKKTLQHTRALELIHVKSLGSSFSKMKKKGG